ncbi:MAG: hypothetical protein KKC51_06360 [Verrucomicrobia bacterium]|nr:hypothetical protein [Verrucomicrobiota bacterium]
MKQNVLFLFCLVVSGPAWADSTIDPAHPYAYGANIGWLNARGDIANGAGLGQSYCTGYVWSANCGWIVLGNGPTNGWQYGNAAADDWGINHDGEGRLSGYAWGANIGWVTFEQVQGQPRVNLLTGNLSGYAWGANVGWIGLSNAQAFARTTRLDAGPDSDADGIPDYWEYREAGDLGTLSDGGHDQDSDDVPDADEYPADTDPLVDTDLLQIVSITTASGTNNVAWTTRPTRFYRVEATNALPAATDIGWADVGGGLIGPPASSPTKVAIPDEGNRGRFYRVQAVIPLGE